MAFPDGLLLCVARLAGIFALAPLFSGGLLPLRWRLAAMAPFLLSLPPAVLNAEGWNQISMPDAIQMLPAMGGELLVGAALGWVVVLVMNALRGAAALLADQMGLSLGGAVEFPESEDGPSLRSLYVMIGLLAFLSWDLHHAFLRCAAESFVLLPPGKVASLGAAAGLSHLALGAGTYLFEAAIGIAFPVLSVLLLTAFAQGALSKAAPEMDFYALGVPIRAAVGLLTVGLTLPVVSDYSQELLVEASRASQDILRLFSE